MFSATHLQGHSPGPSNFSRRYDLAGGVDIKVKGQDRTFYTEFGLASNSYRGFVSGSYRHHTSLQGHKDVYLPHNFSHIWGSAWSRLISRTEFGRLWKSLINFWWRERVSSSISESCSLEFPRKCQRLLTFEMVYKRNKAINISACSCVDQAIIFVNNIPGIWSLFVFSKPSAEQAHSSFAAYFCQVFQVFFCPKLEEK